MYVYEVSRIYRHNFIVIYMYGERERNRDRERKRPLLFFPMLCPPLRDPRTASDSEKPALLLEELASCRNKIYM